MSEDKALSRLNPAFLRLVQYAPLLLLLVYPLLCRYDFHSSTLSYYDFFSMNGNILWFLVLVVCVAIVGSLRKSDVTVPSLLTIVLLFSVAEVYTNYPMIWRDVFLHGSDAKAIILQGHTGDPWFMYSETHPGFSLLWSVVSIVSGLQITESNLIILLPAGLTAMTALLVAMYRRLSIEVWGAATLLSFLLMNFNTNEFMFVHFNTRLLSLIYILVFVQLYLSGGNQRAKFVALLTTNAALVISHALNALVPVVIVAIALLDAKRSGSRESSFLLSSFLLCAISYAAWNVYVGIGLISAGLTTFLNVVYFRLALDVFAAWSPLNPKPTPFFGTVLVTYYKALAVVLGAISLYCAVRLRRQTRVRLMAFYGLSVLLVYGLSFFSLLTWISAHRGILTASVPLAALPMILLTLNAKNPARRWRRQVVVLVVLVLVIPHFVLVHEMPVANWARTGSLDGAASFTVEHRGDQTIASLGDFPIYYCYYEPFYKGYENLNLQGLQGLADVADFLSTRPEATLKIVHYRAAVDWSWGSGEQGVRQWDAEVYGRLDQRLDKIYSNGFDTIYY